VIGKARGEKKKAGLCLWFAKKFMIVSKSHELWPKRAKSQCVES